MYSSKKIAATEKQIWNFWLVLNPDFNYFRPADSVKAGGYFFYAGKTLIGAFQGIFHGDRDFFDL